MNMKFLATMSSGVVSMSSREIAELVGKRHDHVLRDIRVLVDKLVASPELGYQVNQSVTTEKCEQTGRVKLYHLDKDTCYNLMLGYDPVARMKVVKRWQELEEKVGQSFSVPTTFSEALRLAADQQEVIEQQQHQLAIAAPKAEFVDRYVDARGSKGFREVCKLLGANEREFRAFLVKNKIMYKLEDKWTAYAQYMNAGYFETKAGVNNDGYSFTNTKFTPRGINWISGKWAQHNVKPLITFQ